MRYEYAELSGTDLENGFYVVSMTSVNAWAAQGRRVVSTSYAHSDGVAYLTSVLLERVTPEPEDKR